MSTRKWICIGCSFPHETEKVGRLPSYCTPCMITKERERSRAKSKAMRDTERYKQYRSSDEFFWKNLYSRYRVSQEQIIQFLDQSGWKCPGCERSLNVRTMMVDHDHKCCVGTRSCGQCVRGVLCGRCNFAIGNAGDDPATLIRLASYLQMSS